MQRNTIYSLFQHMWIVFALLQASLAFSVPRYYSIEMVVFSRPNLAGSFESIELSKLATAPISRGLLVQKSMALADGLSLLPKSSFQLKNAATKIRTKLGGRILFHSRWMHPLKGTQASNPWYRITGKSHDKVILDGYIKLSIDRYIEITTDLRISYPQNIDENQTFFAFQLNEFRKFRSKDIQYFDHPAMGIIIKATKSEMEIESTNSYNE